MPQRGTVTELAFRALDQRYCCKQDMHVQNNQHEDEEEEEAADRNFPQNIWTQWVTLAHKSKEQSGVSDTISYADMKHHDLKLHFHTYCLALRARSNSQKFHTREEQSGTGQVSQNSLPEQVKPSPVNPSAQAQWQEPGLFTHWALALHRWVPSKHSSRSAHRGEKVQVAAQQLPNWLAIKCQDNQHLCEHKLCLHEYTHLLFDDTGLIHSDSILIRLPLN